MLERCQFYLLLADTWYLLCISLEILCASANAKIFRKIYTPAILFTIFSYDLRSVIWIFKWIFSKNTVVCLILFNNIHNKIWLKLTHLKQPKWKKHVQNAPAFMWQKITVISYDANLHFAIFGTIYAMRSAYSLT